MSIFTLKRHLDRNDSEDVALRQVVALLLGAIEGSAVNASELECAAFREDIDRIRNQMSHEAAPDSLLLAAGSATQAIEAYNKGITRLLQKQGKQLQSIVNMMAETVVTVGGQHLRSAQRLQEIGDGFERAGAVKDFETLKSRLGECLTSFREETLRQKEEADSLIVTLRDEIQRGPRVPEGTAAKALDTGRGTSPMHAGVAAMHEVIGAGKRRFVVTMAVNSVKSVNARYGNEAGDRVLRTFGTFVAKHLGPSDKLFRWSGPAFVALLERTEKLEQIRTQFKRMLEMRIEETFEIEGRSVLIPISAAWTAFQMITTVSSAERQIQSFIASQGNHDFA